MKMKIHTKKIIQHGRGNVNHDSFTATKHEDSDRQTKTETEQKTGAAGDHHWWTTMAELETTTAEQETTMAEQETTIADQETITVEQETTTAEQETTTAEQKTSVDLAEMEMIITGKTEGSETAFLAVTVR